MVPARYGTESELVLTLTENASTIVKAITEQTSSADSAGLRFSPNVAGGQGLDVAPVEAPEPGDQVVEEGGAKVYLEETAAVALGEQVLDAAVDESGTVQFSIAPQNGATVAG
ncbi:hypothetical protein GCM10009657_40110 [Oryzihumus leptocrescens]